MRITSWQPKGAVPPRELAETRLHLHHAAQLVAAVGRTLAASRPDDSHTSLEWDAGALLGQEAPGLPPWRAALRPSSFSVAVVADGAETSRLGLAGCTLDEAFAWLADTARARGAPVERLSLAAPYALSAHPLASGARFPAGDANALAELAGWFADGDALLRGVASGWPGAAPVRVWPHHFDVGSVLPLGAGSGEHAASIGVGLSPGDEGIAEPYLYVTLWPALPADALPALAAGSWHREGWVGALLTGSDVVAAGDGAAQAALADRFTSGAVELLRSAHAKRS